MSTKKIKEEKLNIINIYNSDNKNIAELKLIFNKKLLNMIYALEKDYFESDYDNN